MTVQELMTKLKSCKADADIYVVGEDETLLDIRLARYYDYSYFVVLAPLAETETSE